MNQNDTDFLTPKEVARITKLSVSTIYQLCKSDRIPHYVFGKQKRFRPSQVTAWIAENHHPRNAET